MSTPPSADRIEQVSFGFMASKVLFSAIEFGLFTKLAKESMDAAEIQKRCGLHPRGVRDFLDTLVALRMLERRGDIYSNTSETDFYLDRAKPTISGTTSKSRVCGGISSSIRFPRRCEPVSRRTKSRAGMRTGLTLCTGPRRDFASSCAG